MFLELKTSHHFKEDPKWSTIMEKMHSPECVDDEDVSVINSRVIGSKNGPSAADVPG